eukprot:gene14060-14178_t
MSTKHVKIPVGFITLTGDLSIPEKASGLVIFAHGSGSSRTSPRNQYVAAKLNQKGIGTLLIDLLTSAEEIEDRVTGALRFNIPMLAKRLAVIGEWAYRNNAENGLQLGYFGASTGAAAALMAAARQGNKIAAVVSRGGRPDLAMDFLGYVTAPVLLIVGQNDPEVVTLNRKALEKLNPQSRLDIVPGATHLFEESGALEDVAQLAADWFAKAF